MGDDDGIIAIEQRGKVLLVTIDDGKANALTTTLSRNLEAVIDRAEADTDIGALVIAGRPGRFSAGFDLGVFQSGDMEAIGEMVAAGGSLVARAYGAGVPVVSACTGHAVAAGALLLLGCDHRVGADAEIKIGLNEVAIGLVLPDWALTIAQERLSRRHVQAAVAGARLYDGRGAVDAGFLDEAVAPDDVIEIALARAAVLAELDPTAYATTIGAIRGSTLSRMASSIS
jgi:enoyl-CoA hydratase